MEDDIHVKPKPLNQINEAHLFTRIQSQESEDIYGKAGGRAVVLRITVHES